MSKYIRQEQFTEFEGVLVDDKAFYEDAEMWAYAVAGEMKGNIDSMMPHQSHSLANSVRPKLIKKAGYIENISFGFWRSGIFQAYGVGKYLIHTEMGVIKGRKSEYAKMKRKNSKNNSQFSAYNSSSKQITRKPKDWFDTLVVDRTDILADLVESYYGDKFVLAASAGQKIIK